MEVRPRPGRGDGGEEEQQAQAEEHVAGPPPVRPEGYGFGRGFEQIRTRGNVQTKTGTSGQTQKFFANYFQLQLKKTIQFLLYKVTFSPEIETIGKRSKLLNTLDAQIGPYLFEGVQLFTTHLIPPELLNLTASFPNHPEQEWTVKIEYVRECDPGEAVVTQMYNVLIKSSQEVLGLTRLGQYYFDAKQKIDIRHHRLQLWPGFITSIRQMEQDVLLNVDLTFKVCRTETVFDKIKEIRAHNPANYKTACEAAIVGSTVMTTYNSRTYKITEIGWDLRPTSTFPAKVHGILTEMSFQEYFARKGLKINASQPMLVSGPTKRDIRRGHTGNKILPPDICCQTGIDNEMRSNFRLMKDLAVHFHMQPQTRIQKIVDFVRRMLGTVEVADYLVRWGARLANVPVEVQGRLLDQEILQFVNGGTFSNENADWTSAFRNEKMLITIPLQHWVLIYPAKQAENIDNLVTTMVNVGRQIGLQVSMPLRRESLVDVSRNGYVTTINALVNHFRGQKDLAMIFAVLPHENSDAYGAIKCQCTLQLGIPSQCFLAKNTTSKNLRSICNKMLIQMNAKLGGEPWGLSNLPQGLMVAGFDVHHGTGQSYGALVATTSANLGLYFSTIVTLEPGTGMSAKIGAAMMKCLKAYGNRNHRILPARIMFYRDGVGDGQLRVIVDTEVAAIMSAISTMYELVGQASPKFTMIVVTRRINTRLFLSTGEGNNVTNPRPGSVADNVITCPEKYDFYMVPQTVRQGTVSPVAFNVIHDTSGLSPDQMHRLTFKLCHGYFNWTGTVSVPAPCQYARKLSMLTGTALMNEANAALLNNLHFL